MNHKITPDILDIALRVNHIELCDSILTEICKVVNVLNEKGEKATIKDVLDEKAH